jgi:hypothetical protein
MLESFKDETVPEEFKQFMIEQGVEEDKVGTLIDVNPRMLLDVFDASGLCINIERTENKEVEWAWGIASITYETAIFKTRKEAEYAAIEEAFELLEIKLSPKVEE